MSELWTDICNRRPDVSAIPTVVAGNKCDLLTQKVIHDRMQWLSSSSFRSLLIRQQRGSVDWTRVFDMLKYRQRPMSMSLIYSEICCHSVDFHGARLLIHSFIIIAIMFRLAAEVSMTIWVLHHCRICIDATLPGTTRYAIYSILQAESTSSYGHNYRAMQKQRWSPSAAW